MQIIFGDGETVKIEAFERALGVLKQFGSRMRIDIEGSYGDKSLRLTHVEDEPAADPLRLAAEIAGDAQPIPPLEARP